MFWSVFVGLCAKRGVSPNAVAKELALSSGSVTSWKGGAIPRPTTIKKIADYFGVSPDLFLAETDDPGIKKAPESAKKEPAPLDELLPGYALLTEENKLKAQEYIALLLNAQHNP